MLRLNIGSNQKIGQPNYGSRGASVHFEVELESSLVRDPQQLQSKVRTMFRLARDAVHEELGIAPTPKETKRRNSRPAKQERPEEHSAGNTDTNTHPSAHSGTHHRSSSGNNGHTPESDSHGEQAQQRPATTSQVRAILAIAARNQVDLEERLRTEFGICTADDLSLPEASQLIDSLKSEISTTGGRR